MLRGMSNLDYKERLVLLDAETVEFRRLKIDLVTVYKILFRLIDIDFNDYFAFKRKTELPAVVLVITIVLLKAMGVSMHDVIIFAVRTIKPWNSLPEETLKFNSLASFKRTLNSVDVSSFCVSNNFKSISGVELEFIK